MAASTLRLGTYPYTFARVSAMKGAIFKKEDYDRLLKMSTPEIVRFLQDTTYRKEIDEFAAHHEGLELVEIALRQNLGRTLTKLQRISTGALRELLDAYLARRDIENIKIVLRAKFTGDETAERFLVPAGNLSRAYFQSLLQKDSVEDAARLVSIADLSPGIEHYQHTGSLFEIENLLDRQYYIGLLDLTCRVPTQGVVFGEFLKAELDVHNVMTILRLTKEGFSAEKIGGYLFADGQRLRRSGVKRLLSTQDIEDILDRLKSMGFGDMAGPALEAYKGQGRLADVEVALGRYLLHRATLLWHQHPLSIDTILGFMLAKEIEVRNLIVLIKAKLLGLPEEFMQSEIIAGR